MPEVPDQVNSEAEVGVKLAGLASAASLFQDIGQTIKGMLQNPIAAGSTMTFLGDKIQRYYIDKLATSRNLTKENRMELQRLSEQAIRSTHAFTAFSGAISGLAFKLAAMHEKLEETQISMMKLMNTTTRPPGGSQEAAKNFMRSQLDMAVKYGREFAQRYSQVYEQMYTMVPGGEDVKEKFAESITSRSIATGVDYSRVITDLVQKYRSYGVTVDTAFETTERMRQEWEKSNLSMGDFSSNLETVLRLTDQYVSAGQNPGQALTNAFNSVKGLSSAGMSSTQVTKMGDLFSSLRDPLKMLGQAKDKLGLLGAMSKHGSVAGFSSDPHTFNKQILKADDSQIVELYQGLIGKVTGGKNLEDLSPEQTGMLTNVMGLNTEMVRLLMSIKSVKKETDEFNSILEDGGSVISKARQGPRAVNAKDAEDVEKGGSGFEKIMSLIERGEFGAAVDLGIPKEAFYGAGGAGVAYGGYKTFKGMSDVRKQLDAMLNVMKGVEASKAATVGGRGTTLLNPSAVGNPAFRTALGLGEVSSGAEAVSGVTKTLSIGEKLVGAGSKALRLAKIGGNVAFYITTAIDFVKGVSEGLSDKDLTISTKENLTKWKDAITDASSITGLIYEAFSGFFEVGTRQIGILGGKILSLFGKVLKYLQWLNKLPFAEKLGIAEFNKDSKNFYDIMQGDAEIVNNNIKSMSEDERYNHYKDAFDPNTVFGGSMLGKKFRENFDKKLEGKEFGDSSKVNKEVQQEQYLRYLSTNPGKAVELTIQLVEDGSVKKEQKAEIEANKAVTKIIHDNSNAGGWVL